MTVYDKNGNYYNNWAKKFEGEWTLVTVTYKKETGEMFLYVNDELVTNMNNVKEHKPFKINESLRSHNSPNPFIIGFCPHTNTFFKGQIGEVKIFNKYIENLNDLKKNDNLLLYVDFQDGVKENVNNGECEYSVKITKENFDVIENILPFRREGHFDCMFHNDEGFVNGKWAKGETTARNERRFVTEMQQGLINYKEDGINNILNVLNIENIDVSLYDNTKFINVKMK